MRKSVKAKLFSTLAAAGFVGSLVVSSDALALTCDSLNSGNWTTPTNWTCNAIPSINDDVTINTGHNISVVGPVSVARLFMDPGSFLSGSGSASLTANFNLQFGGPTGVAVQLTDIDVSTAPGPVVFKVFASGVQINSTSTLKTLTNSSANPSNEVAGQININSSSAAFTNTLSGVLPFTGGSINGQSAALFNNYGTIQVAAANMSVIGAILKNYGTISVPPANQLTINALPTTFEMAGAGALLEGAGTIVDSSSPLSLANGTTTISNIQANVLNNGTTMSPGGSGTIATQVITGNYVQTSTGNYFADVNVSAFDQLQVSGTVSLSPGGVFALNQLALPSLFTPPFDTIRGLLGGMTGNLSAPKLICPFGLCASGITSVVGSGNAFYRTIFNTRFYQVSNAADSGSGSLRGVLFDIATDGSATCPGSPYLVKFDLPLNSVINLMSPVTVGACATTINGFGNAGSMPDGAGPKLASTATYGFKIDGSGITSGNALSIFGPGNNTTSHPVTIRGLHIEGVSSGAAVAVQSGAGVAQILGNKLVSNNFGVFHDAAPGLIIGSTTVGDKNIISGNAHSGIHSINQVVASTQTQIVNNLIGVDVDAVTSMPNTLNGILVNGSSEISISNNIIANNGKGVNIVGATAQKVRVSHPAAIANLIHSNTNIGIDLGDNLATPNDIPALQDADTGPNGYSNYALVTGVVFPVLSPTSMDVSFSINALPGTTYEVLICNNPPGESQCRVPLFSSTSITTNGSGFGSATITTPRILPPWNATAIATPNGGPEFGNTSEISTAFLVASADVTVAPATLTFSETLTNTTDPQTITVSNSTALPITITSITLPAGFVIFADTCMGTIPASPIPCALQIKYTASAVNTGGLLQIVHAGVGSPTVVTLVGQVSTPAIMLSTLSLSFTGLVGVPSTQPVTITNTSTPPGTLTFTSVAVTGPYTLTGGTCGATLPPPPASCTKDVTFTATGSGFIMGDAFSFNYNAISSSVSLSATGSPGPQSILGFAPPSTALLSAGSQILSATATPSMLPVIFATSSVPTICTVAGNVVTYTGVGICSLTANQAGNANYTAAATATASISISAIPPAPTPLTLAATFTPPAVGVNAQSIFTLTINNTDSISPASNLVLSNIAPTSGASFAASPIGGNCGGTASVTSGVLNLVSGSVPASGSCFITVPISSPTAGLYNVNLPVGSATSVIGGQAGFVAATLSVQNLPNIVATPVAATTLTFSAVAPNTTSPVQTVSLLNSGSAVANLSKTVTGPNASLFAVPDNCAGTINPAGTCVFSVTCTPIAVGSFTATLSITHNAPNTPSPISYPLSCTSSVTPVAPAIVGTPPNATVGVGYSFGFTATGTAPITWSTTGTLPAGITFNSASGVLSGTPLTAGTFSFSVVAANGTLPNATKPVSIVVAPIPVAPTISGTPPSGAISVPYSFTFTASGTAPATWTSSGTLPPGLTLNASTGAVAGTPTTAGSFTFSVTAANGTLPNATQPVTIVIGAIPAAVFSSLTTLASFPNQVINRRSDPVVIIITNSGNAPLNLSGISISNPLFTVSPAPAAAAPVRLPTEAAKLGKERALNLASPAVTIAADPPCVFSASASIAPTSSCSISLIFAPTAVGTASGTLTITHNAAVLPATSATAGIALSGTGVLAAVPVLEFVPANFSSINFGSQIINTTTQPARTITIKNSGQVPLNISNLSFSNPQFSRFAGAPGNCALSAFGSPISAGAIPANTTCEINVVFTPSGVSAVVNGTVGKLTITHNGVSALAASAPVPATSAVSEIDLIGTGIAAPVANIELDALALAFGSQVILTTSAAKTVTVTNRGNAPLSISAITVTGGNNARPVGTLGGTCSTTVAVGPGLGCTVTLTFSPSTVGDKTGTLSIVSNASNLPQGSNGAVRIALTGTGIPVPAAGLLFSTRNLNFGSQTQGLTTAKQQFTVANNGNANLIISGIVGAGDFGFQSNCPITPDFLIPTASCAVNVDFTPVSLGAREGSIVVNSNAVFITAEAFPNRVVLTGVGSPLPVPELNLNTASLRFGSQTVGSQAETQAIILTNIGLANLLIRDTNFSGDADFARSNNFINTSTEVISPCGASLAPTAKCYYGITFAPVTEGSKVGQFIINTNLSSGPSVVTLSGTATPRPRPNLGVSAQSINLGDQTVATQSSTRIITVTNLGDATLNFTGITLSGVNATEFALPLGVIPFSANPVSNPTNARCVNISGVSTLAPGANCVFFVAFNPLSEGNKTARVDIVTDAANAATVNGVDLTGNATPVPVPRARLSSTALGFGNTLFISTAQAQTVTLTSVGTAPLDVASIVASGEFAQTNNCPSTLVVNASCNINISFSPRSLGTRTGSLLVTTNATPPSNAVTLSGTSCRWFSVLGSRVISTLCAP